MRRIQFPQQARADVDQYLRDLAAWSGGPETPGFGQNAAGRLYEDDVALRRDLGLPIVPGSPGYVTGIVIGMLFLSGLIVSVVLLVRKSALALIAAGTFGMATGSALLVAAATWFVPHDDAFWMPAFLGGVLAVLGAAFAGVGSILEAGNRAAVPGVVVGATVGIVFALTSSAPAGVIAILAGSATAMGCAMGTRRPLSSSFLAVLIGGAGALVPASMAFAFGVQAWVEGSHGDIVAVASIVVAAAVTVAAGFLDSASRRQSLRLRS